MIARLPGAAGPRLLERQAAALFLRYYRPQWRRLLFYAVAASIQSLLVLPVLLLIRMVFDDAIPQGRVGLLPLLGGGILLIRLIQSGTALWLRAFVLDLIKGRVQRLRQDLIDRLFQLSREHLSRTDLDRVHTRIVLDSDRFESLSSRLLSSMLPALISSLALAAVALALNWRLVAMAAILLPVLAWTSRLAGRRVQGDVHECQHAMEQFSKGVRFTLRQLDLIRLQSTQLRERERQHGQIRQLSDSSRRMAMSFAIHGQVQRNLTGIAGILILVAGGAAVAQGQMSLGDLMSFYVAAGLLNGQLDTLTGGIPELVSGNEALTKLRGLLDDGEEQPYRGRRSIAFDGSVSLREARFAYDGHQVLNGIDLEIRPGERVAIVGPNGAGKTTLINLLVGFGRPQSGVALANGVPYDAIDLPALRTRIGVVMQQPSFFAGTILENLRYGRPDADRDAVQAAARLALADDFICALPQGYDSEIGEAGALLSGGERQRLAIARALLGSPRLLILDEPTNHLERAAIARLMANLLQAPGRPGILLISHDPGVVAFADRVYRLEHGRLFATPTTPESAEGRRRYG